MDEGIIDGRDVWRRFREASTTLGPSPGERDRWRAGRARYAVWVLRVRDRAVTDRVAAVRRTLGDWIVPVADRDLHVTLHVAGFPARTPRRDDDVSEATLARQRDALERVVDGPLRVEVGGANAFRTCAILDVHDAAGDLARVRAALGAIHREQRFAPYHPHVTVGTFPTARDTARIREKLEPARAVAPLALEATCVELVELDASCEGAALETRWSVACGPARGADLSTEHEVYA